MVVRSGVVVVGLVGFNVVVAVVVFLNVLVESVIFAVVDDVKASVVEFSSGKT